MNKEAIVDSIVARLQADFAAVGPQFAEAKRMPENEADYDPGIKMPVAYVVYFGSQADPSISTRSVAQPRKLKFNIEIHSRKLYGSTGMGAVTDVIEQSIEGFAPANCNPAYLLRDDFIRQEQTWVHSYQWECETMLVQKNDSDPIIVPSFQQIINDPDE